MRVSFKTSLILLVLLLVIGSLNFSRVGADATFSSFTRPGMDFFWSAGGRVSGFMKGVFSAGRLAQENAALVQENLFLRQQLLTSEDERGELNELRDAFGLKAKEGFQLLAAEIYGKRTGEEVLLVARGSADGVRDGMVAVTAGRVLVGRVTQVLPDTSRVLMISSKDTSFDAAVQGRSTSGILRGKGSGRLLLNLVPQEQELEEGDIVMTSNVAEIFPENLLVGRVRKVAGSDVEAFWQADVSWFFDSSRIDQVFLIQ
ncbi:MAG: rod shape-determining protein MreC [bacterium]|nr:rod shape-determining protein MreC [bacterium]